MPDRTARRIRKLKRSINLNGKKIKRMQNKDKNNMKDFVNLMKTELKVLETKNYEKHLVESEEEIDNAENANLLQSNPGVVIEQKQNQSSRKNDTLSYNKDVAQTSYNGDQFVKNPKESLKDIAILNPLCDTTPSFDHRIWDGAIYLFNLLFVDDSKP